MYELCRHILPAGRRCTQPAVTGTVYCRHHGVIKRTVADSILPPKFHGLHRALPFLYPEDRAAIQANCFLVMRALDDRRIDTRTANAMNRLLRTCQANLKAGPLHQPDSEEKSPGGPLKRVVRLSGEQNTGAPQPALSLPKGLDSETWEKDQPADPSIVHRVILTPSGEELAPPLEVWEDGDEQHHGQQCPCRRCAQQYRAASPEQHHPNCRCGQCPARNETAGAPSFRPAVSVERVGEQDSSPPDSSLSGEQTSGTPSLEETWDEESNQKAVSGKYVEPFTFDDAVPRDPYAPQESAEERRQESERRMQIMEKHKDRIAKVENQYLNSPELAERITAEIQQIMELEMGTEAFTYQIPQPLAS